MLTIECEKKSSREENKGGGQDIERRFGSFSRSIRLPFELGKDEEIDAQYDKGPSCFGFQNRQRRAKTLAKSR